jgi:hypothetical protein
MERPAVIALLLAAGWFQAVQYAPRAVSLRGCADCRGEPDDVCEVRAGAQSKPIEEYPRPLAGRIRLLRPSAETACAVPSQKLVGARAVIDLAAVRVAAAEPSVALLEAIRPGAAVHGWPRAPPLRGAESVAATPERSGLRLAVVCWPSERGWPSGALSQVNACEWWLLAVDRAGEPNLAGVSFPLAQSAFAAGTRWPAAFDKAAPLSEAVFAGAPQPSAPPAPAAPSAGPVRCGEAAGERTATLDRFDQWDRQIRGDSRPSLERASFTLRSPLWSGHCQEMDVLRAALEQQLGCALQVEGRCE